MVVTLGVGGWVGDRVGRGYCGLFISACSYLSLGAWPSAEEEEQEEEEEKGAMETGVGTTAATLHVVVFFLLLFMPSLLALVAWPHRAARKEGGGGEEGISLSVVLSAGCGAFHSLPLCC